MGFPKLHITFVITTVISSNGSNELLRFPFIPSGADLKKLLYFRNKAQSLPGRPELIYFLKEPFWFLDVKELISMLFLILFRIKNNDYAMNKFRTHVITQAD